MTILCPAREHVGSALPSWTPCNRNLLPYGKVSRGVEQKNRFGRVKAYSLEGQIIVV